MYCRCYTSLPRVPSPAAALLLVFRVSSSSRTDGGPLLLLLLLLRPLNFEPRRGDFLPFSTAKSSALSFAAFIFPFLVALRDLRVPFLVPSSSIREQLSPLTHDDSFFFCRDLGGMFDEIGVSRLDGLFLGCYLRRIALRVKL